MKNRRFFLAALLFVFCFFSVLDAQSSKQVLSLVHFLQSKYLGTTISYHEKKIVKDKPLKLGEVANVVLGKDAYYFILEDDTWVKVIFEVSNSGPLDSNNGRHFKSKKDLQIQVLQAEQFLNATIAKVGTDGGDTGYAPIDSINQAGQLIPNSKEDFTSAEEIIYTDLRSNRQMKGNVLVSLGGIVLDDGSPISILFVSGTFGSKN